MLSEETTVSIDDIEDYIAQNIDALNLPSDSEDWNFIEQRLILKETVNLAKDRVSDDPFEQNLNKFPEDFTLGRTQAQHAKVSVDIDK